MYLVSAIMYSFMRVARSYSFNGSRFAILIK